ncbi:hypothetical protein CLV72_10375 [Allonocardiopsis opalescens]|uniref:Fido domain-containing protein n=2 Tax=Allonocardiopsis opalescens TaxID=1144618 RepID=A0A2T0Q6N4_9ACTN|nr:hypothetical protein CLV72_10375 [Allonocardiopsis opalescens]
MTAIAELPGVADAVHDARTAADRLLGHRAMRRHGPEVSAESLLRGARASAVLEGASITLERIRADPGADPRVQGALRISAELGRLRDTWRHAPRQVLARLHVLGAADLAAPDALGRPRSGAPAADPLGLGEAPAPAEAAGRLAALSELVTARGGAPALVVAAVVHAELAAVRPFGTADGLVARAAMRLVLLDLGLDPKSAIAPEVGHLELGAGYPDALRGYLSGGAAGVAGWVRHCADAVVAGARESLAVCEALTRG